MQSIQEQLMQEMSQTPTSILQQVLDFLRFLKQQSNKSLEDQGEAWPPGFFEEVIGGWEGEKLTREPQPDYEIRQELR
jgi:hypothetical protein